jgi:hypothetical protein
MSAGVSVPGPHSGSVLFEKCLSVIEAEKSYADEVEKETKSGGVSERVRQRLQVLGVAMSEVEAALEGCDVFVLSQVSDGVSGAVHCSVV